MNLFQKYVNCNLRPPTTGTTMLGSDGETITEINPSPLRVNSFLFMRSYFLYIVFVMIS